MLAARIHEFNQPLQIDDVPIPEPGPNQVLLKVAEYVLAAYDYVISIADQPDVNPACLAPFNDTLDAPGRGDIVGGAVVVVD